jgi:hypothetical protein
MYHKLGPRPRGVRFKGLFISRPLLERQLLELQRAGFTTLDYGPSSTQKGNAGRKVALTFDDGFANVFQHGLEPLARHGFRAIEFLVANLIGGSNDWELQKARRGNPSWTKPRSKSGWAQDTKLAPLPSLIRS